MYPYAQIFPKYIPGYNVVVQRILEYERSVFELPLWHLTCFLTLGKLLSFSD